MTEIKTKKTAEIFNNINIKIVGVGGGGGNSIDHVIRQGIEGVNFISMNTDKQAIAHSLATKKIILGHKDANIEYGMGAGADPKKGEKAALESKAEIKKLFKGSDLVIIAAGLGGGTGTGAAPVIAQIAKEMGILTIGIGTLPFLYEGEKRKEIALKGKERFKNSVDSMVTISNDLLAEKEGTRTLVDSFTSSDNVIYSLVETIVNLIQIPSLINTDFADIKTVIRNQGNSMIGIGEAYQGQDQIITAALDAISNPLSNYSIGSAKSAIVWITGSSRLTLNDANEIIATIQDATKQKLNIIFGVTINNNLNDKVKVSIIATGINENEYQNTKLFKRKRSKK